MKIKVIENGDTSRVIPMEEIDMTSSVKLREELMRIVRRKVKNIQVDLSGVEYIDSSGLATLIECLQEVKKYGGKLTLVINDAKIMEVFKLARLDQVFHILQESA